MQKNAIAFVICFGLARTGFGFSSDGSSLERAADRLTVWTNSPVVFTVTFTNGGPAPLRGFYYSDQIPAGVTVQTLSVSLNGVAITNYTFEAGQTDDVYPGCIPYRWIVEQPISFIEDNPILAGGFVQIAYSVMSSTSGTFALNEYSWAAYNPGTTNSSFGYSEVSDRKSLTFLPYPYSALLSLNFQSNCLTLNLISGTPGWSYIIQESSNLSNWTPCATNNSPFDLVLPNTAGRGPHFYRALWIP